MALKSSDNLGVSAPAPAPLNFDPIKMAASFELSSGNLGVSAPAPAPLQLNFDPRPLPTSQRGKKEEHTHMKHAEDEDESNYSNNTNVTSLPSPWSSHSQTNKNNKNNNQLMQNVDALVSELNRKTQKNRSYRGHCH
eukprot:511837_1